MKMSRNEIAICAIMLLQFVNISLAGFDTGTQGSYDSYIVSAIIGIALGMIVLVLFRIGKNCNWNVISVWVALFISNILIGITQWPYVKYVLIGNRRLNAVITNTVELNIDLSKPGLLERLLPLLMIGLLIENITICIKMVINTNRMRNLTTAST